MYTFSPMMVANSRKHHCRVRPYTREVLVLSTNLEIQTKHYSLVFRNRRGDEARIKKTWYNQGSLQVKCYNCNGVGHIARNCTQPKRPQNSEYFKDKMLLMQAQENGVVLDEEQLLFLAGRQDNAIDEDVDEQPVQDLALNVDNVFQADDCDAYDSDVDEAPTAQTMFMANLSSADPVYDEAGPSYDSDILSEVQDHDHFQDAICEHHEEHGMQDVYVKDNAVPVVQNNASTVPNDMYVMIDNDLHEPKAQSVFKAPTYTVADNSLNVELAIYKEQVELKHDEIEWKNLLIEHDIIIADGLSKKVFYVVSNYELNVSRFIEMQKAHNVVKARCLELEAELSNLCDNIHKDNYNEFLNRFSNLEVVQIVLWYLDSGCSKHMTGDRSRLMNFMKKFIGTVRFGNDHFGAIMGYGDYVVGDSVISRVYYVEGLGHNLFSVGQFCDSDLEVAFRKHSCYVRDTDGVELLKGSRGSNLYTIFVEEMMKSSPICLLSKASSQIMVHGLGV
ncbi:integrase, catalytic region, zinc finger, CCHC-type containing protein [Tanacetum coccineum]